MARELVKWEPFREVSRLRREMDRLWEDFLPRALRPWAEEWAPAVDVAETADKVTVKAEVPGMDPKEIDISLVGDLLTIKGEKKSEREETKENYHLVERTYGSFSRAIRLPAAVNADQIEAKYEKGVLTITCPKKEPVKPKAIEIKTTYASSGLGGVTRRQFLVSVGVSLAVSALTCPNVAHSEIRQPSSDKLDDWSVVRDQFDLSRDYIQLAPFYIASHPRPVRKAIENYRRAIDVNPVLTVDPAVFGPHSPVGLEKTDFGYLTQEVREAVAQYVGGKGEEIALTDSTTMGLALVYNALPLKPGQEMLTTDHDFYSHHESIRLAAERTGASVRKIALFDSYDKISEDSMVARIRQGIRPETRTLGVTWVHSASGLKLPIRSIAQAIKEVNRSRDEKDRVMLIVDGVHGFGVEDENVAEMGCDIFISGTHKWIFGPRGTGIVWAAESTWAQLKPTIPSYIATDLWEAWKDNHPPAVLATASWMTPGGFKAYEHQWAMADAFQFLQQIGRKRIADRTHALNEQCKEGLAKTRGIKLYTPRGSKLSAGLICFDVERMPPEEVTKRLIARKIIMTKTPYGKSYARLAPSIVTTPQEIETTLREIRSLASG